MRSAISTEDFAGIATGTPFQRTVSDGTVRVYDITIASPPGSGLGVTITLNHLHAPGGVLFYVFDGDSSLSTVLGGVGFQQDAVLDWPPGTRFAGSTTAGKPFARWSSFSHTLLLSWGSPVVPPPIAPSFIFAEYNFE